jgi:hypothetical protein
MASSRRSSHRVFGWPDGGWLYLLAGIAITSATVLIPAGDDLDVARLQRDRALVIEARAADRLRLHSDYLDALEQGDETVLLSLTQEQLNATPKGMEVVYLDEEDIEGSFDASVVRKLEPIPTPLPELQEPDTMLRRLTTTNSTRIWVLAGGTLCVLIGLLPPARSGV